MRKVLFGPWRELQVEILPALQQVSIPFKTTSDICPDHYRDARNELDRLNEKLTVACQSLRRNISLAMLLSPSRYSLLIDISGIQENVSQLMDLLDEYYFSCLKSSRRLSPQRRKIMTLFDAIMQQLEDIPALITPLEKDIEVQEQRLRTIIGQEVPIISRPSKISTMPKK